MTIFRSPARGSAVRKIATALLGRRVPGADPRQAVHFLHIGKTAGTQFERVADHVNATHRDYRIVKRSHGTTLHDLPEGVPFLFSIRQPESRFVSGFYSRKRKGRPRYDNDWSPYEAVAFAEFEHANDLAEALFEDGERGRRALCALEAIGHCARNQIEWFHRAGTFLDIRPPMAILRQEAFERDLAVFLARIGVDLAEVPLTDDPGLAHRTDYSATPPLSEKARRNLFDWYRRDVEFYRLCEHWIAANQPG